MEIYTFKTDDHVFEFQFILKRTNCCLIHKVDTRIYFIDMQNAYVKILKFKKLNMKPNEDLKLEINSISNYEIKGNLVLKIINSEGSTFAGMYANFYYGTRQYPIKFDGFLFYIPVENSEPENPTYPENILPEDEPFHNEQESELFPYIYMRKWPCLASEEFTLNFLIYTQSIPEGSGNLLIKTLIQANSSRTLMIEKSTNFIEGKDEYSPVYLKSIEILESPFNKLFAFYSQLSKQAYPDLDELKATTLEYFQMTEEVLKAFLTSENYLISKESCWQTYFSLIFVMGYNLILMDQLTGILICTNLLEKIFISEQALDAQSINNLLKATICLPNGLFLDTTATNSKTLIKPCAIGDLQLIKQSFLRYELGEISEIINVIKGEEKEIRDRSFTKNEELDEHKEMLLTSNKTYDTTSQASLNQLINQTINNNNRITNFSDLQTTYGPPNNFTYSGKVTYTDPDNTKKDNSSYAKEIVNKALSNFSNTIYTIRKNQLTKEAEKITISKIDNRNSTSDHSSILRWVNKIYQNYIVNYGTRLMYELLIEKPSDQFIYNEMLLKGIDLQVPTNPKSLGISSYKDISRDNFITLSLNYSKLSAPLPLAYSISTSLNGSETKTLKIKEQYEATLANIAIIQADSNKIQIAIGTTLIKAPPSDNGQALKGETGEISVSSVNYIAADSNRSELADYMINIEIKCSLVLSYFEEWQLKVYKEIIESYNLQLQSYYTLIEEHFGRNKLSENIQIIKNSVIKRCKQELYTNYLNKTGTLSPNYPSANFNLLQFIDTVFEWSELYFVFIDNFPYSNGEKASTLTEQSINCGEFFNQFLLADYVQIILPVRANHELVTLLFTDTGILWDGKPCLCCCSTAISENDGPTEIANEIKKINSRTNQNQISDLWEIKIPTDMQLLQESKASINGIKQ